MSLTIAYIIPTEEKYVPSKRQAQNILNFIETKNQSNLKVENQYNETVQFYDCGENFEKVTCPYCGKEVNIEWWQDEMERSAESDFSDLRITTPCCGANSSLNNLNYYFTQGFARFSIKIYDYENDKLIIDEVFLSQLKIHSGIIWKVIISRY